MLCRLSALALVLCAMLAASAAGQGCPDALKSLSAWTAYVIDWIDSLAACAWTTRDRRGACMRLAAARD